MTGAKLASLSLPKRSNPSLSLSSAASSRYSTRLVLQIGRSETIIISRQCGEGGGRPNDLAHAEA